MPKICAIIVTYHPDNQVFENLENIYKQVDKIVIVDNTPAQEVEILQKITENYSEVEIIYNADNLGIAKALNQGVKYAIEESFDWVLTMDQDSTLTENMVANMFVAYDKYEKKEQVGILSPIYLDKFTKNLSYKGEKEILELEAGLTSGQLVKTELFEKCGFFREDYFIYHVDTEYCLRIRKHGYKILQIKSAILLHEEGKQTKHSFLWKKGLITTNHSAFARYYITRNTIFLMKEYFFSFPKYIFKTILNLKINTLKIILFEDNKFEKIFSEVKGTLNAFFLKK